MKKFKFGIIVPNYNYEKYLKRCLKSILNQTYKNFQIIFIDDMSTDNSLEIAKHYLKEPHKVISLKQKRYNGGARNTGYLYLDPDVDYVMYVDSDDFLYNVKSLKYINEELQEEPDVLFTACMTLDNGEIKEGFAPNYRNKYDAIKGFSGSCGKVIKKSLATRGECLYNEGTLLEDRNQHRRICIYMNTFKNMILPTYVWNRDNLNSLTHTTNSIKWKTSVIRQYADTLELYLNEKGKDHEMDIYLKKKVDRTKRAIDEGDDRQW